MKVSEIAKEFKTTSKFVLETLKGLKLKAKDSNQEINRAVLIVLRGELAKAIKEGRAAKAAEKPAERPADSAKDEAKKSTATAKTAAPKKTAAKTKKTAKKAEPAKEKDVKEKPAKKTTVKKTTAKKTTVKTVKVPEEKPQEPVAEKQAETTETEPKKAVQKVRPLSEDDAPFVSLKPLSKKKRKSSPRSRDGAGDTSASSDTAWGAETAAVQPATAGGAPAQEGNLIPIELDIPIAVKDFAVALQQKTGIVLKKLMQMRVFANINSSLGEDVARGLAKEFGYEVTKVKTQEQQLIETHETEEEDSGNLVPRAPVITFMGHVDHGKTSLLDRIRKSRVTDQEHGGITQHIGAYSVAMPKGRITFLDTPGHEAFTAMRSRGAHITDIVVLVVAAEEGIMPQTEEAIDHARAAGVPIVVALNKIDKENADPDRVKKQLSEHDLTPEDWGGKTVVAGVSAVTGEGIDNLLELILLEAELLELTANPNKNASGIVVEAHLSGGKGAVASLIVQSGTLKANDYIVVGPYYGKVKALFDDFEKPIQSAGPSTPVEILGLSEVPEAGEKFYVVQTEKEARDISESRKIKLKDQKFGAQKRITLEDLYSQVQEGTIKELNVILKADVQGSLEALKDSLEKIPSDEVKVKFIHIGVGDINASDIILANASTAIIIGFHVGIGNKAQQELDKHPVDVRQYRIIYDAVNDVRKALEGMLDPRIKRQFVARVEVRQVFKLSKSGIIAGCFVLKGKVTRKANVDVVRNGEVIHTATISSLKRFKDDVREVMEGYECGIAVQGFDKYQAGDIFEVFSIESIARTL